MITIQLPSWAPAALLILALLAFMPESAKTSFRHVFAGRGTSPLQRLQTVVAGGSSTYKTDSDSKPVVPAGKKQQSREESRDLQFYKDLYHKLQNLESHPEVLAQARDLLITFFAETTQNAQSAKKPGILAVEEYSEANVNKFVQDEHDDITGEWEEYCIRRRNGGPAEMFKDKEECFWWLKQAAPVKYVDGAWLGHINKVTTPFHLRKATKDAWQIMSEELGDGEPAMNHVYVYRKLMKEIGAGLPEAGDLDFISPRHEMDELTPWRAAVSQLLISLFPHEFLPEILGFNMHFEALTMETMKAAKEVEEFGFDAYYFILHISIDNADSGHTAIAAQAVIKYLETVRQHDGDAEAQRMWKRVQVGFNLSKHLSVAPESPSKRIPAERCFPRNPREEEVINIFIQKAPVAQKVHCTNRVKLGGKTLVDWLDPEALKSKEFQMEFMDTLGNFKPWVRKGDAEASKLMAEITWEGKMFGSFTKTEVESVRRWIDGMGAPDPEIYWSFIQSPVVKSEPLFKNMDIRVDYPVFKPNSAAKLPAAAAPTPTPAQLPSPVLYPASAADKALANPNLNELLPLWFTHQCLLEAFVNVPAKTTDTTAANVVRTLRAQYGFDTEGLFVSGMDEARRDDTAGLVELGLEIMAELDLGRPDSLKAVLEQYPSSFALEMMHLSMRPMEHFDALLGLSWSFVGLHELMSNSSLLASRRRALLAEITKREHEYMGIVYEQLKHDAARLEAFYQGFTLGREKIAACFSTDVPMLPEDELIAPENLSATKSHQVSVSA